VDVVHCPASSAFDGKYLLSQVELAGDLAFGAALQTLSTTVMKLRETQSTQQVTSIVSEQIVFDLAARIPCLNHPQVLHGLQSELEKYLIVIGALGAPVHCIESFWHAERKTLPTWHHASTDLMLFQPSSAAVERFFSIFLNVISDNQGKALEDYQSAAMMVNYNQRERKRKD
jgi:hypothetical protein